MKNPKWCILKICSNENLSEWFHLDTVCKSGSFPFVIRRRREHWDKYAFASEKALWDALEQMGTTKSISMNLILKKDSIESYDNKLLTKYFFGSENGLFIFSGGLWSKQFSKKLKKSLGWFCRKQISIRHFELVRLKLFFLKFPIDFGK